MFKGKRLDNSEWVEGSLWLNGARALIRTDLGFPVGASWCEVDPASVGQFIGFLDKHGERIFEGDVVTDERLHIFGNVVYSDKNPSFIINCFVNGPMYNDDYWEDLEIYGNIHDDPKRFSRTNFLVKMVKQAIFGEDESDET